MATKEAINLDNLSALGVEKLAQLVKEEAVRDAVFRKLVTAALSAGKGPKAVMALVDRRLTALEKAKSFINPIKVRDVADELGMLVKIIRDELAPADPVQALTRVLRFIAGSEQVLARAEDSHGRIQGVYAMAMDALVPVAMRLSDTDRGHVPDMMMSALPASDLEPLPKILALLAPLIPPSALTAMDGALAQKHAALTPATPSKHDWKVQGRQAILVNGRQVIAKVLNDVDGFIALENTKPAGRQKTDEIARLLLQAGRATEALEWVRRDGGIKIGYMDRAQAADRAASRKFGDDTKVKLEAQILDALKDRTSAQSLRWDFFEKHLHVGILRDYIAGLDDFDEFDAIDRAFATVESKPSIHQALAFLVAWPKMDRASAHVIKHKGKWQGEVYDVLAPAAQALEEAYPAAATILYRALLNDILTSAKSHAYGFGGGYLNRLDDLAASSDAQQVENLENHAPFRARLALKHGKKYSFWALVQRGL